MVRKWLAVYDTNLALTSKLRFMTDDKQPFSIKHTYPVFNKGFLKPIAPIIDRTLALHRLNQTYHKVAHHDCGITFMHSVNDLYQLAVDVDEKELEHIPQTGGCIVVANHPTGLAETLLVYTLLLRRRKDVKLMATTMLSRIHQLRSVTISTDNLDTNNRLATNKAAIKAALDWVKAGHVLVTFPAGEVSHFTFAEKQVIDGQWSTLAISLSKKTNAPILPICFKTRNNWLFNAAGVIHPFLRTMLIPRAFEKAAKKVMPATIGLPIAKRVIQDSEPKLVSEWLRRLTYALSYNKLNSCQYAQNKQAQTLQPLMDPVPREWLLNEIAQLPKAAELHTYKHFSCYGVLGSSLNHLMKEIGRVREMTFRQVGEGTGKAIDTDYFDAHYYQIFIWDHQHKEVVGGYRIGLVNDLLAKRDKSAIYLSEFYHNALSIMPKDGKAADIGRSFIAPAYQCHYQPLFILWQGIGKLLLKNPGYRYLFGLVSLSRDSLSPFAMRFLIACLRNGQYKSENDELSPKEPYYEDNELPRALKTLSQLPLNFSLIKETIETLENKKFSLPVLLKHYCQQLGAKCLNFSTDPDFGSGVDVLIITDLAKTKPEKLARYMGKEIAKAFQTQFQR